MAAPPGVPPFAAFIPPPLPPGWTEHQAPGGQTYYYNASTNQSTYTRPLPAIPFAPQGAIIPGSVPKKKKERPLVKTPVPGTAWLRVKTTEGNIFWTHKEKKESVWEVPEEIKEQVSTMEREEREKEEREVAEKGEKERAEREREEEKRKQLEREEVERVMEEVKGAVAAGKRKAAESDDEETNAQKKARIEDATDEDSQDAEWQREATPGMAVELEQPQVAERSPPVQGQPSITEPDPITPQDSDGKPSFKVPDRVDLSLDEAKALFKTLLQEKQINPLHPWDTSLPLFISDPRYVLLPSVSARREAFDEYCRDAARAQRLAKAAARKEESENAGEQKGEDKNKEAYARLLREEVTSTRTTWHEFRRKWKKDRRFFAWASDRERERVFRDWVKDLGQVKKKAAEKAEREFFQLLREHKEIKLGDDWKEVKRTIDPKDPRYDAVGSSSLREELFGTYVKTLPSPGAPGADVAEPETSVEKKEYTEEDLTSARHQQRKERAERGLREREEKVKRERAGLERELGRTRGAVGREEGEREFMTLLTDAVRDPQAVWDMSVSSLSRDPRYVLSALPAAAQRALFDTHVARLREKYLTGLHALFTAHAPDLSLLWSALPQNARASIQTSLPAKRLGLSHTDEDDTALKAAFERWQRTRTVEARQAFDGMLGENAFLEFWGRMGKAGGRGVDASTAVDEGDDDEGDEGGGKADLKKLAKTVDVGEVAKVLKNDARWSVFDHVPEQREIWLRGYMEQLAAPKLSVHVADRQ